MEIKMQEIQGYVFGAIQPSVLLRFSNLQFVAPALVEGLRILRSHFPENESGIQIEVEGVKLENLSVPVLIVSALGVLNCHCGDQRFTPVYVYDDNGETVFLLPTLSPQLLHFNMISIQKFIQERNGVYSSEAVAEFAEKQKLMSQRFLPSGSNAGNFIAAAAERRLPFKIFSDRYLIFGYGSSSTIFNSSVTDQESAIGVALAGSKIDTHRLLEMAGFPVARQARVNTIDEAVRYANELGYPVVLKPSREEQGRGVYSNIIDETELRQCFEKCSSEYQHLILEKFIRGYVYRANVVNGKVVRVVKRYPATIIGDGVSSISHLIDAFNQDPDIKDPSTTKKPVIIDFEVLATLRKQGKAPQSVPERGESVQLTTTANMSRGGCAENFIDKFHDENFKLALDVAQTMRLKIAGIDIISPDASAPWVDNGAVICEVNAQPQLTRKEYNMHDIVLDQYYQKPIHISVLIRNGGQQKIDEKAIFDASSKRLSLTLSPEEIFQHGCPTQYFNYLEIADDVSENDRNRLKSMLVSVMPHSQ